VRRRRRQRRLVRGLTSADVTVPAELLADDPDHVLQILLTYLGAPLRRARIGTQEELTYLRLAEDDGLR
jgi:hypothetical protein